MAATPLPLLIPSTQRCHLPAPSPQPPPVGQVLISTSQDKIATEKWESGCDVSIALWTLTVSWLKWLETRDQAY